MSETPDLRASDADRERTADLLRHAAGEGRLTVEELDERLDVAYAARTSAELDRLLADVVVDRRPVEGRLPVRPGEDGTRRLISVLSGHDRKGRWRIAPRCSVINVMGGSDLDFNDAELAADRVELRIFSLMGGTDIRVPEGLNVEVSEVSFMGGNDIDLGVPRPDPGGPVLAIRIVSIMGGTDITRGRKKSRAERRLNR